MHLIITDSIDGRKVIFLAPQLDGRGIMVDIFTAMIVRFCEYGKRTYPQSGPRMAITYDVYACKVKFFNTIADIDFKLSLESFALTVEHFMSIPEEAWARMTEPGDVMAWARQMNWTEVIRPNDPVVVPP